MIPPPELPGARYQRAAGEALLGLIAPFVHSVYGAVRAPGDALKGRDQRQPKVPGQWSDEDEAVQQLNDAAMRHRAVGAAGLMIGGGTLGTASGATLGAGVLRRRGKLPMDEASRLERAVDSGFDITMPLAHGASRAFSAFDPAKLGVATGTPTARQGVWSEIRKGPTEIADFHAERAAKTMGGRPQVYPLVHRAEKRGEIHLKGEASMHGVANTIAQVWDDGFDAVVVRNFRGPGGTPGDMLVVKNANQLRSPFAAFDPAKRESSHLLAGIVGAGGFPAGLIMNTEPSDTGIQRKEDRGRGGLLP
jgi:hypothetical protein